MKIIQGVLVLCLLMDFCAAQTSTPKISLDSLRFLIGEWEAIGEGGPGTAKGGFTFAFDLQNKVIVRKNYAEYPASANRPATKHEDLMVIYVDDALNQIRANYFDTEGHQINYKVTSSVDDQNVTFISESLQSQPRYRLSYAKLKDGTLSGRFEIAPPGQPEGFKTYLQWISTSKGSLQKRAIAYFDFFGYGHLDVVRLRSVLPIHAGESIEQDQWSTYRARIEEAIRSETGKPPTDVALVCCNEPGNSMVYIGVAGTSSVTVKHKRAPTGAGRLPAAALKLSHETDEALSKAVQAGRTQADNSNGYALSADPELRAKQLQIREFALANEDLLRTALSSSSNAEHRAIAAEFLGYVNVSPRQIADLAEAARDPDSGVRNNAVRALGVIAGSSQQRARMISPNAFITLLKSDKWVDRNKGGWLMINLTETRNPKLLKHLRTEAMDALVEMARWHYAGHASFARRLLGRIAGIEETKLDTMIDDQAEAIIAAAKKSH